MDRSMLGNKTCWPGRRAGAEQSPAAAIGSDDVAKVQINAPNGQTVRYFVTQLGGSHVRNPGRSGQ